MLTPTRIAALCALIAADACQRATVVPISTPGRRWASVEDANAAAGHAVDTGSVEAQRRLLGWMKGRLARRAG